MLNLQIKSNNSRPAGLGSKILGSLFFSVFFLGGLVFLFLLGRELWQRGMPYTWTETECQITASNLEQQSTRRDSPYEFQASFQYLWNGEYHSSDTAFVKSKTFESPTEAQLLVHKYAVDSKTVCYVNPRNPAQAILIRENLWLAFFLVIPLVFIVVGGGGVYAMWAIKLPDPDAPESGPLSEKAKPGTGQGILLIVCSVFLIIGAILSQVFFVGPVMKILAARNWAPTECVVESSQVRSHRGDDGTTYSVDILYRYTVDGMEYRSNQYQFMRGSSSGRRGKQAIVKQYPKNKKAVCYVNLDHPEEAVLERGFTLDILFGLIPLAFALGGGMGLFYSVRKRLNPGNRTAPGSRRVGAGITAQSGMARVVVGGSVELRPQHARWVKLVGIILIAAFWNGIVSVFVWQVIQAWSKPKSGFMDKWFLPIFLIPFVLVGLGLIAGIFYTLLGMFNPRPRLTLPSTELLLGDAMDLQWRMDGRTNVLQRLRIFLEGREEAVYQRGTRSYTDKKVFATIDLTDVTSRTELRAGQARIKVPVDTMHTLEGKNNKILWTLHVKGEIRRWPDVDETFPIKILPTNLANISKNMSTPETKS